MITPQEKLIKFNLNLMYTPQGISIEEYTNFLINSKMNEFEKLFEQYQDRLFVIDFKDDVISLICYRMMKNLQSVCKFKFSIALLSKGLIRNSKYINKQDKQIGRLKLNSLIKKNKVVIVSPINLLYKVIDTKITFKKFDTIEWRPFENFIPEQLRAAQIFYHIGYIKKDKIQLDSQEVENFNNFCNNINYNEQLKSKLSRWCCDSSSSADLKASENREIFGLPILSKQAEHIDLVWIEDNLEKDIKTLQEVEQSDGLILYYSLSKNLTTALKSEYKFFVKNKENIPNETNFNNKEMTEYFLNNNKEIRYFGDWPQHEKEKLGVD